MGLISFLKNTGKNIFGNDEAEKKGGSRRRYRSRQ